MKYKYFIQFVFSVTAIALLNSCYRAPEFPRTPSISFTSNEVRNQVQYYDKLQEGDSLIVNIKIQDGNGDVGLSSNETSPPFNAYFFYDSLTAEKTPYFDEERGLIKYGQLVNGIPIKTTLNDTLPPYETPYILANYFHVTVDNTTSDIYYVQRNPDQYNIFITFLMKDNAQDEFEVFRFEDFSGDNYNARIPRLSEDETPLESTLSYSMTSLSKAFEFLFKDKIMKLRIMVKDRELNSSNVIETEPFTLVQVQAN